GQTHDTVEANGINIYYEMSGSGPYLILIEGLGVATWLWEKQVPDFSKHFTAVVYDNRGAGKSDKPEGPYSIGMLADDLAALMQALNIPKAHILGVSMGGFVAQDFALRYPDKVEKLVLVSTSAGGPDHVPMSQETLSVFFLNEGSPRDIMRKKLALAYSDSFMAREDVERLIDLRLKNPQPQHAFMAQVAAGTTFDLSEEVKNIQAPTLIAAASDDLLVPVENAHNLAKNIPNSQLKIYEGLGHQFFVEIPDRFNQDVIDFLTD
ncbi:alpha/beta fold hydrolase, partial [candidate division KSB1 bacterium]|nr:alpha/beta fold hydrolase [candidate division KSB1 bacterium]NIR69002.1 alpha/beta fold hydrolase [candidate division KSB1 bacterium]NIS25599.1 alpha/beta fold hydrolase [candidate division KSB1 bacterium]NIT72496.1 alpha/beta fold hydrolase [candidate division KSB1 bacterium]NIU26276.1 alpha/beta fold hydrolase [candidate division KSB1 bacterium]